MSRVGIAHHHSAITVGGAHPTATFSWTFVSQRLMTVHSKIPLSPCGVQSLLTLRFYLYLICIGLCHNCYLLLFLRFYMHILERLLGDSMEDWRCYTASPRDALRFIYHNQYNHFRRICRHKSYK